MQSGVSADRKDRKILCMTSRRGTGTDKGTAGESRSRKAKGLNGKSLSAWQPVARNTFAIPLDQHAR